MAPVRPGDGQFPMPAIAAGDLYRHRHGGLYLVDSFLPSPEDDAPRVVLAPVDPEDHRQCRPLPAHAFAELLSGARMGERPRLARIAMPGRRGFEHFVHDSCGLPARLVDAVLAQYAQPGRFYHGAWHVEDMFARALRAGIALSNAQIVAILFHDAVYRPGAAPGENEQASAGLLRQWAGGLPRADIESACRIIGDTEDHLPRHAGSEAVIALDLASLADSADSFDAYTEMLWLEARPRTTAAGQNKTGFLRERDQLLIALAAKARGSRMLPGFDAALARNIDRFRLGLQRSGAGDVRARPGSDHGMSPALGGVSPTR